MFSQAFVILFTGECLSQCMLGYTHPREQTPPAADTPWQQTPPRAGIPQSSHPPGADTTRSRHPPEQTQPPEADTPRPDTPGSRHPPSRHHPRADTPLKQTCPTPHRRACWEIRSTRGRYASYWNAILFCH